MTLVNLANLAKSAFISAAVCSGVEMNGSTAWLASYSLNSDALRKPAISDDSFTMIVFGVPAGASTPNHVFTSKDGSPASAKVGT